jgi:hypothetical protein
VSVSQLEVEQVHADLQAVARLTLTAEQVPALTFTEYYDELGPGVQAFVQLEQGTFRLWNNSTDPAGRSLVVLASPGEPIAQVTALLTALDLPGGVLTQLWTGKGWLTGDDRRPQQPDRRLHDDVRTPAITVDSLPFRTTVPPDGAKRAVA